MDRTLRIGREVGAIPVGNPVCSRGRRAGFAAAGDRLPAGFKTASVTPEHVTSGVADEGVDRFINW